MPGQESHKRAIKAMSKSTLSAEAMGSFAQHRGSQEKERDMRAI